MSVVENVRYRVPEEDSHAFVAAWRAALPVIRDAPGNESVELSRCIEHPDELQARVVWTELDDHSRFRHSDAFATFKSNFTSFTIESIAHYQRIELT